MELREQTNLLQRGREALELLERQALAARLDAQLIQLRAALALAQNGESHPLERWLCQFDRAPDWQIENSPWLKPSPVTPPDPLLEPATLTTTARTVKTNRAVPQAASTVEPDSPCEGWSSYLAHARQRLAQLNHSALPWDDEEPSRSRQLDDQLVDDQLPCDWQATRTSASQHTSPQELAKLDWAGLDLGQPAESETVLNDSVLNETAGDEPAGDEPVQLDWQALHALDQVAEQSINEGQPQKRLWGSLALSLIGHALLFAVLGTITYQHERDEIASLGAQVLSAVEASEEADLGAQLEMIQPQDSNLEPLMSPSSVAASTELAGLSTAGLSMSDLSKASGGPSPYGEIAAALGGTGGSKSSGGQGRSNGRGGGGVPKPGGQFFGVGSGGNYFCYIVDSSGSMRGEAWSSAKKELVRSLMTLKPTQQFYIIFFANELHAIPEPGSSRPAAHGLLATSDNIDHARRWIETIKLSLGGPPTEALAWAIEREPDAIYLLTDGVTKVDVCSFVRKVNQTEDLISGPQIRVPIHPIAYHSLAGQQLMRQLADENKGHFHYVPAK